MLKYGLSYNKVRYEQIWSPCRKVAKIQAKNGQLSRERFEIDAQIAAFWLQIAKSGHLKMTLLDLKILKLKIFFNCEFFYNSTCRLAPNKHVN